MEKKLFEVVWIKKQPGVKKRYDIKEKFAVDSIDDITSLIEENNKAVGIRKIQLIDENVKVL